MVARRENVKEFRVEGITQLLGWEGETVNRIMIRVRGRHNRKVERWIDLPGGQQVPDLGDMVMVQKQPPYRIVTEGKD